MAYRRRQSYRPARARTARRAYSSARRTSRGRSTGMSRATRDIRIVIQQAPPSPVGVSPYNGLPVSKETAPRRSQF